VNKFKRSLIRASIAIAALGAGLAAHAADYVIKVSHAVPPSAPLHKALLQFKTQVEAATNKRVEVRVFHSSQLGGQRESLEAAQTGAIEMVASPNGVVAAFAPDFQLMDIPFQFQTLNQARTFLDKSGEKLLFPSLDKAGLVGLAMWEQGFRNIGTTKKPVNTIADMHNMQLRTMEAPMHITAWRAIGANPTPLGWSQVYTAMQQGLLEGVENPSYVFTQSKITETIKYFSISKHVYDPIVMVGSKKFFDSLPADLRTIVVSKLRGLTTTDRQMAEADVAEAEQEIAKKGIKIVTFDAAQRKSFLDASQPAVLKELNASLGTTKVAAWQAAVAAVPAAK
jgi:tripartite ATP-independent transporter DctP family solute receptor